MAYSQATLIKEVRAKLNDNPWYDATTGAFSPTTTGTTATVADSTKWDVGDVLETQDDGELMLVTAVPTSTTLTVIRNYQFSIGTTAGTGTVHASGTQIVKNPVFPYYKIVLAIATTLRSLWPWAYVAVATSITPSTTERWYAPTAGTIALSSAVQLSTSDPDYPVFYGGWKARYPIFLRHGIHTDFSQDTAGYSIYVPRFANTTNTLYVTGIAKLTATVSSGNYSDLSGGIDTECVSWLTAAELVAAAEVSRVTQEDVTMGDASVAPGARARVSNFLRERGLEKRRQWTKELEMDTPIMREWEPGSSRSGRL